MLKDELYKIFSWKVIYIALGIFVLINLFYFNSSMGFKSYRYVYDAYYKGYEGRITQSMLDHADKLEAEYSRLLKEDKTRFRDAEQMFSYLSDLQSVMSSEKDYYELTYELRTDIAGLSDYTESYEYKEKSIELEKLEAAGYLKEVRYARAWQGILQYNRWIGFFFIGILIVIGLAPVFSEEYSQRTDALILSSKYGRTKLVRAKILACLIYCFFITLIFTLIPLAFYAYTYGLNGFDAPLKQVFTFYSISTINVKIWQLYLIQRGYLLLGSICLGLLTLVISSLLGSTLVTAVAGSSAFLVPGLLTQFGVNFNNTAFSKQLNYAGFLKLEHLFDGYNNYTDFIGNPVRDEYIMLGAMLLLAAASCILISVIFKRREVN